METGVRSARNELFQELKPRCVELSQLALRDDGSSSNAKALIKSTTLLYNLLSQKFRRSDGVFDSKLADYVFFPLSQILRQKKKYTDALSELTVKCLHILLEYGWRDTIALDLAKQLLMLLTFVVGGVPGLETTVPEELASEAYGALAALFADLGRTVGGSGALVESATMPVLGHCVTVILDGIKDGPSADVQLQSLEALDAVWHCIKDAQALSTFLPGTISALTKALMPGTATRRSKRTIVDALGTLAYVLVSLLSDIRTRNIRSSDDTTIVASVNGSEGKNLTKSWLKATTGQIKLALANVVRLRTHESVEIRQALNRLCLTILDECHDTLADSASMLVETCMTLSGVEKEEVGRKTTLTDLAVIHTDLGELIKSTIYSWVTSLPRVMQSNDERAKDIVLNQLSKAHDLLETLNLESSVLEDTLGSSLRDSITVMQDALPVPNGLQEAEFDLNSQAALTLTSDNALTTFKPIIMSQESQRKTRVQMLHLISSLGSEMAQLRMASEMLEYARNASGPSLLSAYWLSTQLVQAVGSKNQELDEFFSSSLTRSDGQEAVHQELFYYSQSMLADPDEKSADWRLQAVALEVVASAAQRLKEEFRTELVDTLYPIAQLLGSPNAKLREHAITCLNIVSQSCGYSNAGELIVDNVDYMINAISFRLNTFDISPQAPQVLIMMIRLTGPSLLLYLDDVVASIFAALDNFHGYQKLVETLFAVLGEIVDVGSKSGQLQIEVTPSISHRKALPPVSAIDDLLITLKTKQQHESEHLEPEATPQKPWKSAKTLLDEASPDPDVDPSEQEEEEQQPTEKAKPPPTPTYNMLASIARLGQHYLTSSSPHLRSKLLTLVSTSCSALSHNEEQFLPLINDVWPVVITRLYDPEPFVVIAAAEAISEICKGAGDFLATRIQSEWPALMKMVRKAKMAAEKEERGSGGRGKYSQVARVWESIVGLLVTVVGYTRIGDEMFDEVLEVLGDCLERSDVRSVLDIVNSDAVWLALWKMGRIELGERPEFGSMAVVDIEHTAVAT